MCSMKRIIPVLICFFLLPMTVTVRAEVVDWIVAKVNDEIILYSEVQKQIEQLEKRSPEGNLTDPDLRTRLEQEVLRQMVRDRLAGQEAKRYKISVSDGEVNRAIAGIKEENQFTDEQMEYMLGQQGHTLDQLREDIKKELTRSRLLERVLKSKTVITEERVDAYLQQEGSAPVTDRRRLALIFVAPAKENEAGSMAEAEDLARKIHARLKKGEDFAKLAREYSKGPGAGDGGDIGYITSNEMAPPIEKATRELKPGEFTEVVKTGAGFYLLKVLDRESKKENPADPHVRDKIRRKLLQEDMNRKYETWIRELENRAFIQIHPKAPGSAARLSSQGN